MKSENKKGTKSIIPAMLLPLAVSCTWYGSQMGAGTASGANQMNYFVKFGWYGVIFSAVGLLLEFWYFYWAIEFSRETGIYKARDYLREAFHPHEKILLPIYDILALSAYSVATGSCMSGFATVLSDYWGLNYMAALIGSFVLFMVIAWYGMNAIRAVGTALTFIMVAIVLVTLCIGIPANWENIMVNWTSHAVGSEGIYRSLGWAVWYIFLFAASQTQVVTIMAPACKGVIRSKKDTFLACAVGFLFLFVTMVPLSLLLLGRWPGNLNGTSVYILEAVQSLKGGTIVKILYPVLLVSAFTTTGPNYIFNQTERWSEAGFWNRIKNEESVFRKSSVRRIVAMTVYVGISFLLSVNGFGFVTNTLMPALSYGWMIMFVIFMFVVPRKVQRLRKSGKTA